MRCQRDLSRRSSQMFSAANRISAAANAHATTKIADPGRLNLACILAPETHSLWNLAHAAQQISRGKFIRLRRATAGFTTSAFDGYGLRGHVPARPAPYASDPVFVHRFAPLLHASFRPRLTATPLRFAITSRPSRCEEDLRLLADKHARHTQKQPRFLEAVPNLPFQLRRQVPAIFSLFRLPEARPSNPPASAPSGTPAS